MNSTLLETEKKMVKVTQITAGRVTWSKFTWSDKLHLVAFFCDKLILSPKLNAIP